MHVHTCTWLHNAVKSPEICPGLLLASQNYQKCHRLAWRLLTPQTAHVPVGNGSRYSHVLPCVPKHQLLPLANCSTDGIAGENKVVTLPARTECPFEGACMHRIHAHTLCVTSFQPVLFKLYSKWRQLESNWQVVNVIWGTSSPVQLILPV